MTCMLREPLSVQGAERHTQLPWGGSGTVVEVGLRCSVGEFWTRNVGRINRMSW